MYKYGLKYEHYAALIIFIINYFMKPWGLNQTKEDSMAITFRILVSLFVVSLGCTVLAQGESKGSTKKMTTAKSSSTKITDGQLKKFAKAQSQIRTVVENNQQKLQSGTKKEKQAIQTKMVQAVQSSGLNPMVYNRIAKKIQNDNNFKQRYINLIQ